MLNRCTQRTSSLFFTFLLLSPGTLGEIHGHHGFEGVVVFLMVPENSTKMVHNPFRAPIRLPENVVVDVVIVTKREGVRPTCLCLH